MNDKITNAISFGSVAVFISIIVMILVTLISRSSESIQKSGLSFLTRSTWNVRFLELAQVRMNEDAFNMQFTVPIKSEQDFEELISLEYNQHDTAFSVSQTNHTITVIPQVRGNGYYTIHISKNLRDANDYRLSENLTWTAYIEDGKIQSPQIHGETSGEIQGVIFNENYRHFTILPFIIGTVVSSLLALLIAFPVALAVALLVTEYAPTESPVIKLFTILIDLLAGIPSVIYGLWGLFFLVPRFGANILSAALILSIMIMPYAASLSREAISLVPDKLKQAGLGLGASRFKVVTHIILPYARSGIIAGVLLTLGRALGETLAVTMVIGNRNQIPKSLFDPAQTISSLIANEYGEASGLKQSALIESGLVLMIIVLIFSLLGRMIIRHANNKS